MNRDDITSNDHIRSHLVDGGVWTEKPADPGGRCGCGHPRYLHRPGWCRACNCDEFTRSMKI